jgi:hypothetical protein
VSLLQRAKIVFLPSASCPLPFFGQSVRRKDAKNLPLALVKNLNSSCIDATPKSFILVCDRIIAKFRNSTNLSEKLVARVAKEDKVKLQSQLENLNRLAA